MGLRGAVPRAPNQWDMPSSVEYGSHAGRCHSSNRERRKKLRELELSHTHPNCPITRRTEHRVPVKGPSSLHSAPTSLPNLGFVHQGWGNSRERNHGQVPQGQSPEGRDGERFGSWLPKDHVSQTRRILDKAEQGRASLFRLLETESNGRGWAKPQAALFQFGHPRSWFEIKTNLSVVYRTN